MRIAVYGWVDAHAGSVASANHVLLDGLLRRGHAVTLFGKRELVNPPELRGDLGYAHEPTGLGDIARPVRLVTDRAVLAETLYNRLRDPYNSAIAARSVARAHRRAPFDAMLFLGVPALFAVAGLPTVAWPQGPPAVEADAFGVVRRTPAVRSARAHRYWALTAYHAARRWSARWTGPQRVAVICQSRWGARRYAAYGYHDVTVILYAVDLRHFAPSGNPSLDPDEPVFLHLGRLHPRKRIDLLLAAFDLVRGAYPNARLDVIGRPGYLSEITELAKVSRPGFTYRTEIPRREVAAVLRSTPVLVQTSTRETLGTAVVEALACGVTCVVGPDNGTAEYLDEAAGVFAEYTPGSVAEAMIAAWRRRVTAPARRWQVPAPPLCGISPTTGSRPPWRTCSPGSRSPTAAPTTARTGCTATGSGAGFPIDWSNVAAVRLALYKEFLARKRDRRVA
jgi:glycosyltransferase involved in cell wall biosynthesis